MNLQLEPEPEPTETNGNLELPAAYSPTIADAAAIFGTTNEPIYRDPATIFALNAAFTQPLDLPPHADFVSFPEQCGNETQPGNVDDRYAIPGMGALCSGPDSTLDNQAETEPPLTQASLPAGRKTTARGTKREPSRLRTAKRGAKRPRSSTAAAPSTSSPSLSQESERQRSARLHNDVEKAYRERLNEHFEALLVVLPRGADEDSDHPQRLSKAMVLELARRRIRELTAELGVLRREVTEASGLMGLLDGGLFDRGQRAAL